MNSNDVMKQIHANTVCLKMLQFFRTILIVFESRIMWEKLTKKTCLVDSQFWSEDATAETATTSPPQERSGVGGLGTKIEGWLNLERKVSHKIQPHHSDC